jgi:hypothetical protein
MRAQLKRYGMDIAKWGFEVSGHMRFQRVRRGKNVTCHNFRVVRFATMGGPGNVIETAVSNWGLNVDDLRIWHWTV